ncbi:MAG: formylglycine-generating enzyme family protein [Planctomycetaceae bacterium]
MSQWSFCLPGAIIAALLFGSAAGGGEPDPKDPFLRDPDSAAQTQAEMKPYKQRLRDTEIEFEMVPIPGGTFLMGSPADEPGRAEDEGPQHLVRVDPFWMGKCEVTWDEYDTYRTNLDIQRRNLLGRQTDDVDKRADAVTRPTTEYTDMTFGSGHDGYPAICMTELGAKMYCRWLTERTGQYYRLPTEAEWEYACRAGTTTAYSFGGDASQLDDYAWHFGNVGDDREVNYQKVGLKKPNPWGLHDMHGNVMEWCIDQYVPDYYASFDPQTPAEFPIAVPQTLYPRVVRGGSWYDEPEMLRSAARGKSDPSWKIQDPQLPQSMWYHTDAIFVGFRVIRPLTPPSEEQIQKFVLYPDVPEELRKD